MLRNLFWYSSYRIKQKEEILENKKELSLSNHQVNCKYYFIKKIKIYINQFYRSCIC